MSKGHSLPAIGGPLRGHPEALVGENFVNGGKTGRSGGSKSDLF